MLSSTREMHLDQGQFREKTFGHSYNWKMSDRLSFGNEYPHEIYVGFNGETRFANVRKTVAYVVVDEAADGSPVVEKWEIKTEWRK
jgi:hypothetical protein